MYDMLSVAMTGFSDVASPLRPTTMSRPAAPAGDGASASSTASTASTMDWITVAPPSRGSTQRRVEGVAQAVAEQVEAEHGDEDGQAGEGGDPPRRGEELAAFHDHVAPAGQRRLGAEAEIAEARLDEDRLAEHEAGLHDDHRERVDD